MEAFKRLILFSIIGLHPLHLPCFTKYSLNSLNLFINLITGQQSKSYTILNLPVEPLLLLTILVISWEELSMMHEYVFALRNPHGFHVMDKYQACFLPFVLNDV